MLNSRKDLFSLKTAARPILALVFFLSQTAFSSNSHLITQKMAISFNNQIPKSFENKPLYLKQYFVPNSWSETIQDPIVKGDWDFLKSDEHHPNMIRILIHPQDLISSQRIEDVLKKYNLPFKPSYFEVPFFQTESRSLYPTPSATNKYTVSPRLSMTHGFGKWNGSEQDVDTFGYSSEPTYTKLISSKQAEFAIYASRLIQNKLNGVSGNFFEIQPDRMVLTINSPDGSLNMGETFRDISNVNRGPHIGVPGFVQQTLRGSTLLAYVNGFDSIYDYLIQSESKIRGRALAEFFIRTGFVHSSPHSQNFLLEADANFNLTGKLFIRDLADLIPTYDSRMADPKMAQLFENYEDAREALHKNLDGGKDFFAFRHSFFKGSHDENFLTFEQQSEIEHATAKSFLETLSTFSGVPVSEIEPEVSYRFSDVTGDYGTTLIKRSSKVWLKILEGIKQNTFKVTTVEENIKSKRIFEKTDALDVLITKLLVQTLKSESIPQNDLRELHKVWNNRAAYGFLENDLTKLINIMVVTDTIPEGKHFEFFGLIKERAMKDLLLQNLLAKKDLGSLIVFLKQAHKKYSKTLPNEYYFEKTELSHFLNHFAPQALKQSSLLKGEVLNYLYFAQKSITNPEYIANFILLYHDLVKSDGHISDAIWQDLKSWKKEYKSDFWAVDDILKAKVIHSNYRCLSFY